MDQVVTIDLLEGLVAEGIVLGVEMAIKRHDGDDACPVVGALRCDQLLQEVDPLLLRAVVDH